MRRLKQRWPLRLITAMMTLALVYASAIGGYAHALAHCHHGQGHALEQRDADASASIASGMEHTGETQKALGAGPADHTNCCDSICHGGFAIVGQGITVFFQLVSEPPVALMRSAGGTGPQSLDRPPIPLVLA
jgi:hypothetical protein